jgi:hypothetical protein
MSSRESRGLYILLRQFTTIRKANEAWRERQENQEENLKIAFLWLTFPLPSYHPSALHSAIIQKFVDYKTNRSDSKTLQEFKSWRDSGAWYGKGSPNYYRALHTDHKNYRIQTSLVFLKIIFSSRKWAKKGLHPALVRTNDNNNRLDNSKPSDETSFSMRNFSIPTPRIGIPIEKPAPNTLPSTRYQSSM